MAKRRPPPLPEVDVVLVSICTPSLKVIARSRNRPISLTLLRSDEPSVGIPAQIP